MAAFDFPSSPSNGDNYTANGVTWSWDGSAWRRSGGIVTTSCWSVGDDLDLKVSGAGGE